ncbi:MAG: hypothetical protein RR346_05640 [Bacteroidales bacterium]
MKTKLIPLFVLLLFAGCQSKSKTSPEQQPLVGTDRDAKGCIGSAGYVWSDLRQECIRPFEAGIALQPAHTTPGQAVFAAYLVFAQDSGKVEVFMQDGKNVILDRLTNVPENNIWQNGQQKLVVSKTANEWNISQNGTVVYLKK